MLRVGLTGGIGAGKSSVARLLDRLGAAVIDADQLAREVVAPGTPGLAAVAETFGQRVLATDGSLDRKALGAIVFGAPTELARLNAIVHPLVAARAAELTGQAPPGAVVVYDVPLLVENDLAGEYDVVVVVETSRAERLRRLADRGMDRREAEERMAAQADDAARRAVADTVIDNDGSPAELEVAVSTLWADLRARLAGQSER